MGNKKEDHKLNGVASLWNARLEAEKGQQPPDDAFQERWPVLFSLLVNNRLDSKRWTDGARLGVQNASGQWQITLSVPGIGAFTSMLAETFLGGLDTMNKALADGAVPWTFNLKRKARVRKIEDPKN